MWRDRRESQPRSCGAFPKPICTSPQNFSCAVMSEQLQFEQSEMLKDNMDPFEQQKDWWMIAS